MELALNQYISEVYKPSEENIMELLIGDPGTGKNEWAAQYLKEHSDAAVLCNTKPNLLQQKSKHTEIKSRFFQFEDIWDLKEYRTIIIDEADIFYNSSYRRNSIEELLQFIEKYKDEKKFILMTGTFIEGLWFIPKSDYKLTRYTKDVERLLTIIKLVGVKTEDIEVSSEETFGINGNISMYAGTIARITQEIWNDVKIPIILNNNNRDQNEKIAEILRNNNLRVLCVSSKNQSEEYDTLVRHGFKHEHEDGLDVDVVITTVFMSAGLSFKGIATITTPNTPEIIAQQHNRQRQVNGVFNKMYHIAGGDSDIELQIPDPVVRSQYDALMLGKSVFSNMVAAAYCDAYNDYSAKCRLGFWSYGVLRRLIELYGFKLDSVKFVNTLKYNRQITSARKSVQKVINDFPFEKYSDDIIGEQAGIEAAKVSDIRKHFVDIKKLFKDTPVSQNTNEIFWCSSNIGINVLRTINNSRNKFKFIEDVNAHNTMMPETMTKKSMDNASDAFWKNYVNFDVESLRNVYKLLHGREKRNGRYKAQKKEYEWYHVVGMTAAESNGYNGRVKSINDKPGFHEFTKMNKREIAGLTKDKWKEIKNEYTNYIQTKNIK